MLLIIKKLYIIYLKLFFSFIQHEKRDFLKNSRRNTNQYVHNRVLTSKGGNLWVNTIPAKIGEYTRTNPE